MHVTSKLAVLENLMMCWSRRRAVTTLGFGNVESADTSLKKSRKFFDGIAEIVRYGWVKRKMLLWQLGIFLASILMSEGLSNSVAKEWCWAGMQLMAKHCKQKSSCATEGLLGLWTRMLKGRLPSPVNAMQHFRNIDECCLHHRLGDAAQHLLS